MTTEREQAQYVPDWIRAHSDVWATMVENEREEEDATAATAIRVDATAAAQGLPVCGPDCADAERFYRAFTYWCVPLPVVPWGFATEWFALPPGARAGILDGGRGAHAAELGGSMLEMVARLDAPELLLKVPYGEVLSDCGSGSCEWRELKFLIKYDAVRCVRQVRGTAAVLSGKLALAAAKLGALKVLKDYLAAAPKFWGWGDCEVRHAAIEGGHLPVVQWLVGEKKKVAISDAARAAYSGFWPVLEWLRARMSHWDDSASIWCMREATRGGHLEIVQRLRQEGCPWGTLHDDKICALAAQEGKFDVLRWAKANGCPWDQAHMEAQPYGSKRMRAWIAAGGPTEKEEREAQRSARKRKAD